MAATALLAALPLASLASAFDAEEQASARQDGLSLRVRYPGRTLYREDETIEIEVESETRCARAVVDGLAGYLASFEDIRPFPTPPSAQLLYAGPLTAGSPLRLQVQVRPLRAGLTRGTLALACDQRRGPRLALTTAIFP